MKWHISSWLFIKLMIFFHFSSKAHSLCKQCLHDLHFLKKGSFSPKLSKLARADISCQFMKQGPCAEQIYFRQLSTQILISLWPCLIKEDNSKSLANLTIHMVFLIFWVSLSNILLLASKLSHNNVRDVNRWSASILELNVRA